MDPFGYLSVLISIVLGLGITQLLMGFSRWLEQRRTFRAFSPAIAWAGFLLLVHFQTWWSMYGLRGYADWTVMQFSMVLLQPIVLFLLAVLIFPSANSPLKDPRDYFFGQRPWFFGLLLVLLIVSLLKDLVRSGTFPVAANVGFHVAGIVVGVLGLAMNDERTHRWLAYFALTSFVAYIGILFAELV